MQAELVPVRIQPVLSSWCGRKLANVDTEIRCARHGDDSLLHSVTATGSEEVTCIEGELLGANPPERSVPGTAHNPIAAAAEGASMARPGPMPGAGRVVPTLNVGNATDDFLSRLAAAESGEREK